MFNKLKNLFKKEEKLTYPSEFGIIQFNEGAVRAGIEDMSNKVLLRYRYDYRTEKIKLIKTYGYSDSILYMLKNKLKIPIYDATERGIKFPIHSELFLDEVDYIHKN